MGPLNHCPISVGISDSSDYSYSTSALVFPVISTAIKLSKASYYSCHSTYLLYAATFAIHRLYFPFNVHHQFYEYQILIGPVVKNATWETSAPVTVPTFRKLDISLFVNPECYFAYSYTSIGFLFPSKTSVKYPFSGALTPLPFNSQIAINKISAEIKVLLQENAHQHYNTVVQCIHVDVSIRT